MVVKLEKSFTKSGYEGFSKVLFEYVDETEHCYLYRRVIGDYVDYEIFEKKTTPGLKYEDGKFITDNSVMKERYPKANDFGKWAWSCAGVNCEERAKEVLLCKEDKILKRKVNGTNKKVDRCSMECN